MWCFMEPEPALNQLLGNIFLHIQTLGIHIPHMSALLYRLLIHWAILEPQKQHLGSPIAMSSDRISAGW